LTSKNPPKTHQKPTRAGYPICRDFLQARTLVVKGKIIIFLLFLKDFPNYKTIGQEMGYIKIEFMDMSRMDCPLKVDCKKNRSQQEMRSFERHKSVLSFRLGTRHATVGLSIQR